MSQPPSSFRPGQHLEILDDPVHHPYQARLKLSSPTVCEECGALYADGRWQWTRQAHPGAPTATCPACMRIGEALEHSFKARADYAFAKAERLLRVEVKP